MDVLINGRGGGGVNYETHPPRIWGNPGTQNCPTPTRVGSCTTNHLASQPATKAEHNTRALDQFSEISEILSHMSSHSVSSV